MEILKLYWFHPRYTKSHPFIFQTESDAGSLLHLSGDYKKDKNIYSKLRHLHYCQIHKREY